MRDLARRTREREAREGLGGFRDVGPWEEDCMMNDQPDQPTHPSQSPAPADASAALSVREMTAELTNLQGRLNRDAAGGGYQNCPGRLADGRLWFTASTRSSPSFAAAVPRCLLPRISTFNWAAHRLHPLITPGNSQTLLLAGTGSPVASSCTTWLDSTSPDVSTRGACALIPPIAVRYRRPSLRAQLDHGENPRSARTFSAMRICCWRVASLGSGA